VLPFQPYRRFAWAPGRTVLDPAPRLLTGEVVVSDRLAVSGRVLRGEDDRAREVAAALGAGPALPRELAASGIGWVLVERGTPGAVPDLAGLTLVRAGRDVTLYRVLGPANRSGPSAAQVAVVLAGDAAAVGLLALLAVSTLLDQRQSLVRFAK
jgi:hypothetical protein